jgi:hypothetical protein
MTAVELQTRSRLDLVESSALNIDIGDSLLKNIKNFYLKTGHAINKASANPFESTLTSFKYGMPS